jgi:heat shock protein HtpX
MSRPANRVFRVSYRVQVAGVASLLAVPVILTAIAWLLIEASPWLAVGVGAAFVIGLQVAVAKRWTGLVPKPVSPHDAPRIHATVERLCAAGDLAKPKIVLHDKRYANSWIRGLTSGRTTLHLTSRLVELLDERQLEAVIAHELSHVGQKDSTLMSAVGAPVAAMLDGAGLYFHTPIAFIRGVRAVEPPPGVSRPQAAASMMGPLAYAAFFWLLLLRRAASLDVFHIVAIGKEHPLVHTHPPLRRRLKQLSDIETRLQSPARASGLHARKDD